MQCLSYMQCTESNLVFPTYLVNQIYFDQRRLLKISFTSKQSTHWTSEQVKETLYAGPPETPDPNESDALQSDNLHGHSVNFSSKNFQQSPKLRKIKTTPAAPPQSSLTNTLSTSSKAASLEATSYRPVLTSAAGNENIATGETSQAITPFTSLTTLTFI